MDKKQKTRVFVLDHDFQGLTYEEAKQQVYILISEQLEKEGVELSPSELENTIEHDFLAINRKGPFHKRRALSELTYQVNGAPFALISAQSGDGSTQITGHSMKLPWILDYRGIQIPLSTDSVREGGERLREQYS